MLTLSFGVKTVSLPDPDFGNDESIKYRKIQRETRGKELIIGPATGYTKTNRYSYSFSWLTETQAQDLRDFVKGTLGQIVTLVDFEGNTYTGFIITPAISFSEPNRCNITTKFEFEAFGIIEQGTLPSF